jgi:hypothetical protein
MFGDGFTPTRIAGQQNIATYIPFNTLNMELFFSSLHKITLFHSIVFDYIIPNTKKQYGIAGLTGT